MNQNRVIIAAITSFCFLYSTTLAFFPRSFTKGVNWWMRLLGNKTQVAVEDTTRLPMRLIAGIAAFGLLYILLLQLRSVL